MKQVGQPGHNRVQKAPQPLKANPQAESPSLAPLRVASRTLTGPPQQSRETSSNIRGQLRDNHSTSMGDDTETKKKRRKRSRKGADLKTVVTTADEINGDDVVEDPAQLDDSTKPKEAEAANDIVDGEGDDTTKKKRKRKRKRKGKSPEEEKPDESSNSDDVAKLQSVDHTVFVEGLPFSASEDDVRSFFAQNGCDDILQIRLPRWQDTGEFYMIFVTPELFIQTCSIDEYRPSPRFRPRRLRFDRNTVPGAERRGQREEPREQVCYRKGGECPPSGDHGGSLARWKG